MPSTPRPTITRRTVVRAGAWSLPVVAVAAAAPAAVASTTSDCDSFMGMLMDGGSYSMTDVGLVQVNLLVEVSAPWCGPDTSYDQQLALSFTLDDAAYEGFWTSGDDWTPTSGAGGIYAYTVTRVYDEEMNTPVFAGFTIDLRMTGVDPTTNRLTYADPAPISFTLSGHGGVVGSTTVTF